MTSEKIYLVLVRNESNFSSVFCKSWHIIDKFNIE